LRHYILKFTENLTFKPFYRDIISSRLRHFIYPIATFLQLTLKSLLQNRFFQLLQIRQFLFINRF